MLQSILGFHPQSKGQYIISCVSYIQCLIAHWIFVGSMIHTWEYCSLLSNDSEGLQFWLGPRVDPDYRNSDTWVTLLGKFNVLEVDKMILWSLGNLQVENTAQIISILYVQGAEGIMYYLKNSSWHARDGASHQRTSSDHVPWMPIMAHIVSEAIHHTIKVGHLGSVSKQAQRSQRICKNSPDFHDTYQSRRDAFPWLIPKDRMVAVPYDQLTNKTRKTWLWFLGSDPSGMRVWVIPSNKTSKPAKVIAEGMNNLEQMIKKERWWVLVVTSGLADQQSYTI